MSIAHRVTCDACGADNLFGRTHLAVVLQPTFPHSPPMKHFCDTSCLHRFFQNLDAMMRHHATGLARANENRAAARRAATS